MMNLLGRSRRRAAALLAAGTILPFLTTAGSASSDATTVSASHSAPHSAPSAMVHRKPTIVLVHGANAESSSWLGVITRLQRRGFSVLPVANPLRGVVSGAAVLKDGPQDGS